MDPAKVGGDVRRLLYNILAVCNVPGEGLCQVINILLAFK